MGEEQPLPEFQFHVDWAGTQLTFSEITGLDFATEVIEYREGTEPDHGKPPGLTRYSDITMKRGTLRGHSELDQWWNTFLNDRESRSDITISLHNEANEPVVVWQIKNAWPKKIQATDLKADANEVAIESMEVAHEGVTIRNE